MSVIDVPTGAVRARKGIYILKAGAVGSCVVITAFDPINMVGVMAHVMLPGKAPAGKIKERTRYAADAIEELLKLLEDLEADTDDLQVCLAGGGNVLRKKGDEICKANIASVIGLLSQKNIYAQAKALGGIKRRSVSLNTASGIVTYTEGDSQDKILIGMNNTNNS